MELKKLQNTCGLLRALTLNRKKREEKCMSKYEEIDSAEKKNVKEILENFHVCLSSSSSELSRSRYTFDSNRNLMRETFFPVDGLLRDLYFPSIPSTPMT